MSQILPLFKYTPNKLTQGYSQEQRSSEVNKMHFRLSTKTNEVAKQRFSVDRFFEQPNKILAKHHAKPAEKKTSSCFSLREYTKKNIHGEKRNRQKGFDAKMQGQTYSKECLQNELDYSIKLKENMPKLESPIKRNPVIVRIEKNLINTKQHLEKLKHSWHNLEKLFNLYRKYQFFDQNSIKFTPQQILEKITPEQVIENAHEELNSFLKKMDCMSFENVYNKLDKEFNDQSSQLKNIIAVISQNLDELSLIEEKVSENSDMHFIEKCSELRKQISSNINDITDILDKKTDLLYLIFPRQLDSLYEKIEQKLLLKSAVIIDNYF